jgi:hypothetical protein
MFEHRPYPKQLTLSGLGRKIFTVGSFIDLTHIDLDHASGFKTLRLCHMPCAMLRKDINPRIDISKRNGVLRPILNESNPTHHLADCFARQLADYCVGQLVDCCILAFIGSSIFWAGI